MNFDLKNGRKNELKYNNEKSCRWSRNKVSHKIYFKAQGPRNGHADSVGVKVTRYTIKLYRRGQPLIAYSEEVYFWVLSEVRLSGFAG